jgi:hypothetical protein
MVVIAHLSDLHFGTEDPAVTEGFSTTSLALAPHWSDQRRPDAAGASEAVRESAGTSWIDSRPAAHRSGKPRCASVRRGSARFSRPLNRYRHFIHEDVDTSHRSPDLAFSASIPAIHGTWKHGRITTIRSAGWTPVSAEVSPGVLKVVVTHHPFLPPPGSSIDGRFPPVRRAAQALEVLDRRGSTCFSRVHVHFGYSGDVASTFHGTELDHRRTSRNGDLRRRRRGETKRL